LLVVLARQQNGQNRLETILSLSVEMCFLDSNVTWPIVCHSERDWLCDYVWFS